MLEFVRVRGRGELNPHVKKSERETVKRPMRNALPAAMQMRCIFWTDWQFVSLADADLQIVMAAWGQVPEAVRTAIVMLVRADLKGFEATPSGNHPGRLSRHEHPESDPDMSISI